MAIDCAVLMCHAPIVLPEVGGARSQQCARTTAAMEETARFVVQRRPEVLVILSPHTRRARSAWGIVRGDLSGDFARFRAPQVRVELPFAAAAAERIHAAAEVPVTWLEPEPLDHGAAVPLHFLRRAGWSGPTVLIALPWRPTPGGEEAMGRAIAAACDGRWAVVASGDMSHRLIQGAPAGFHPRAKDFDAAFTERVTAGDYRGAASVDAELRELAAEDVVQTTLVAASSVDFRNDGHRTLSYEGPFGVGYLEAVLYAA